MSSTEPEVGKRYTLNHSRKGTFDVKVISFDGEWATVEIIKGSAKHVANDDAIKGDTISVRNSQCFWREIA